MMIRGHALKHTSCRHPHAEVCSLTQCGSRAAGDAAQRRLRDAAPAAAHRLLCQRRLPADAEHRGGIGAPACVSAPAPRPSRSAAGPLAQLPAVMPHLLLYSLIAVAGIRAGGNTDHTNERLNLSQCKLKRICRWCRSSCDCRSRRDLPQPARLSCTPPPGGRPTRHAVRSMRLPTKRLSGAASSV